MLLNGNVVCCYLVSVEPDILKYVHVYVQDISSLGSAQLTKQQQPNFNFFILYSHEFGNVLFKNDLVPQ